MGTASQAGVGDSTVKWQDGDRGPEDQKLEVGGWELERIIRHFLQPPDRLAPFLMSEV